MPDVLHSETCVCGGNHWHMMVDRVLWCRRCGCLRLVFEKNWKVPLDQAGALPSTAYIADEREDPPTLPGTPNALKTSSRTDVVAVQSREFTAPGGFKPPSVPLVRMTPAPMIPLPGRKPPPGSGGPP
jgi:hypothetical protein